MINIDYRIHPQSLKKAKSSNLENLDSMTLHYDQFLGDILLKIGEHNFDADWGWVPVLDFAICMKTIVRSLKESKLQVFEFTESDANITLRREKDQVVLSTNYSSDTSEVRLSYNELKDAVEKFYATLLTYLTNEFPELSKNEYLASIK